MRNFLAIIAIALALTYTSSQVEAQYIPQAQVSQCVQLFDGGAASTATCGPYITNLQPFSSTFGFQSTSNSVIGTVMVLVSADAAGDGGHYADAGLFTITETSGTTSLQAVAISPTNPWLGVQFVASSTAIDGGTGLFLSSTTVIQAQTIHSPHKIVMSPRPRAGDR